MQTNTSFKKSLNLKTHHRSFRTWLIDLYQQTTKIVLTHQSLEKTLNTAIKTRREKSFGAKTNTWQKADFIFKNKKRVLFLANIFCIQSDATLHSCRNNFGVMHIFIQLTKISWEIAQNVKSMWNRRKNHFFDRHNLTRSGHTSITLRTPQCPLKLSRTFRSTSQTQETTCARARNTLMALPTTQPLSVFVGTKLFESGRNAWGREATSAESHPFPLIYLVHGWWKHKKELKNEKIVRCCIGLFERRKGWGYTWANSWIIKFTGNR